MGGMSDHRYKKTEEKILAVFFDNPDCTIRELVKKAGVARSTIYTHYHSIHEIIPDCEKNILVEYERMIDRRLQIKNLELKMLYFDTLVFIARNRRIFEIFLKLGDRNIIMKMILRLKDEQPERIFRICAAEITEVILEWGEGGFDLKKIEKVLGEVMYLVNTCDKRLGRIGYV